MILSHHCDQPVTANAKCSKPNLANHSLNLNNPQLPGPFREMDPPPIILAVHIVRILQKIEVELPARGSLRGSSEYFSKTLLAQW